MPKITFTDSSGTSRTVDAEVGATVRDVPIESVKVTPSITGENR